MEKTAQELFDSIVCLCVEGREVVGRKDLLNAIQKEAEKGWMLTGTVKDAKKNLTKALEEMERPTDEQVRNALYIIVCNKGAKALNYAVEYAAAGIDLRMSGDDLRIQCLYVLNNMSHWQGDDAKKVRTILKAYTKK